MNSEAVKIEQVKVRDLYSFTLNYSANKSKDDIDFITHQRALAHSKNPFADDDDIGMVLAFRNNKCVGYLGLIPGIARIRNKNEKIIWPSAMYVSPEARGQSVGTRLINTALLSNKALVCTGMSQMSEPVFRHLQFKPMRTAEFSEINLRRVKILPIRALEKVVRKILALISKKSPEIESGNSKLYKILKKCTYKIIERKFLPDFKKVVYEEIPGLDGSFKNLVKIEENSFPRPLEWINWMLHYKWVLGKDEAGGGGSNYFFSNIRDHFQFVTVKVISPGSEKKVGFLIFSVSRNNGNVQMKLLDHNFENKEDGRCIAAIILKYAKSVLADSIEVPSDVVSYFNLGIFNRLLFIQREWRFVYSMSDMSSQIAKDLESISTRSFDGDMAFV